MHQPIPDMVDTDDNKKLHSLCRSGRPGKDWTQHHSHWIEYWERRAEAYVWGTCRDPNESMDDYMTWYHNRTVRYISSPVSHLLRRDGHRGDGGLFDYLVGIVSRIGSICNRYLDPANPAQCAHPGLTSIRKEPFGTLQYLNQGIRIAVGPFDHHDVGPSTSHTAPFEMPVEHLPRQVRGRNQGGRRRRRATSLRDDNVAVT
ncbi:serine/threonine-protein phosphatase 7 long form homolog [Coffea arabica]|uniref:Serine/threonine-protein phosphatase 7 long form homolog n=1 Tax=Coffea arabica TaxID=13443 RepID=A0ABM4VTL8_COFAR